MPKENVEAAAEEMARYWLVLNDVPKAYGFGINFIADISDDARERIKTQMTEGAETAIKPYSDALDYARVVIYELVLQKYGVSLDFEPGTIN